MNTWYETLNRPPLTPPNWIFSPVWTILYATIAISIYLYYRSPNKPGIGLTTAIIGFHLITNFSWTFLFFGLRSPGWALFDIVALDISLLVLIRRFRRARPLAGGLLIPYLLWVLFATYLNYGFYRLN